MVSAANPGPGECTLGLVDDGLPAGVRATPSSERGFGDGGIEAPCEGALENACAFDSKSGVRLK